MTDQTPDNSTAVAADQSADEQPLLSWVTHPAKARPVTTVVVVVFLLVLVVLVYSLTQSVLFCVVAALILWGSLTQYFLPTRFELTGTKVRVKYPVNKVEKEWAQYRSYYTDKNGVLLSPFVRPSRLENFRGLYLRFAGNREQVMKIVQEKIISAKD